VTVVCGGGTSGPNFGTAAVIDMSTGVLALRLAALGMGWAVPLIALVSLAPLTLSTFCGTDPPAMPTFTSAETNALLQLNLGSADFVSGLGKAKDLFLNIVWNDFCQCTSGALIPPVWPTTPPAGTPITQIPQLGLGSPCQVLGPQGPFTGSSVGTFVYLTSLAFDKPKPLVHRVTMTLDAVALATWGWSNPVVVYEAAFVYQTPIPMPQIAVGTWQAVLQAPIVSDHLETRATTANVSAVGTMTQELETFCDLTLGASGQPQCCPPDPGTAGVLSAILNLVTLIQRQSVPFGYVTGAVHVGLSGAGVIEISGLLGIHVAITTLPTSYGVLGTSPAAYFDAGFLTFGVDDGYGSSYRLNRNPLALFPPRCSAFTDLAYDLPPGTVVTVTELLREP
jgi:hypothetical protein